jgi:catechol 2,3-dioxygenase-like lactoylglutathione lyase family enzyme
VSEAEFDAIFKRITDEAIPYGSGPRSSDNMEINHRGGGRGFYFKDINGHLFEVLT